MELNQWKKEKKNEISNEEREINGEKLRYLNSFDTIRM
jgi:hypothetical protein